MLVPYRESICPITATSFITFGGASIRVRGRELPHSAAVVVVCPPPPLVLQLHLAIVGVSAAKTADSLSGGLVPTAAAAPFGGVVDVLGASNDAP